MVDPLCQRFFTQPTQTLHRRYEILRAHAVEQRPLQAIAKQFGLNYYTVRSLVRTFRAQCQANRVPPFLSNHTPDEPDSSRLQVHRRSRNHLPSPIVGS
jgi:Homeodomain-like domain